MASAPAKPAKKSAPKGPQPPADAFWRKYSPHFEFPLSAASSIALHTLIVVVLVLIGLGLLDFRVSRHGAIPIEPMAIDGDPNLPTDPNAGGDSPKAPENVSKPQDPTPAPKVDVSAPEVKPDSEKPVEIPPDAVFKESDEARKERHKAIEEVGNAIAAAAAKSGKGSPTQGSGGQPGDGVGPGSIKAKRAARWVMRFNTADGGDYLRQLADLGGYIGIQQADGQYLIYKNLRQVPAQGAVEDISQLNRIFWVDNNPGSVQSLAAAMRLPAVPPQVVAFFPQELENQLATLERNHTKGKGRVSEEQIAETVYLVVPRGGKYMPVVVDQRLKR
jgi:hypothetical protein